MKLILKIELKKQMKPKGFSYTVDFGKYKKVTQLAKPLANFSSINEPMRKVFMMAIKYFLRYEYKYQYKNIYKSFDLYVQSEYITPSKKINI